MGAENSKDYLRNIGESLENKERISSKVSLVFLRHGEKENDPNKNDYDIGLTEQGKKEAMGKAALSDITHAVAFGGPRKRTQETAGFMMVGKQDDITGNESLEELKGKIDRDIKLGTKIGVDDRLNFIADWDLPYGKEELAAYKKGELLKFLVYRSDDLAKEVNDKECSTYSVMAANIAGIIDKYISIAPRWDKLVKDESKNYPESLERIFGTHQGVNESFLAKVIEKIKGAAERDNFVNALDGKGFDTTEGFNVEIITNQNTDAPEVRITYRREKDDKIVFEFDEVVPLEVVKEIINDSIKD